MKRPLLAVLLLACANSFSANVLSLETVLESVKKHYPLVQGADFDVTAARAEETASEGAFDLNWKNRLSSSTLGYYENYRVDSILEKPVHFWGTNLFTGYRLGQGSFPVYEGKALTLSQGELRAGFEISLWRNRPTDRRRSSLEKAKLGVTVAEANALQARLEAVRIASQKYWDWAAAGNRVTIFRKLLLTAEERDKGLAERVRHGDVPEFERKDNERAILQRKAQLIAAERGLQQTSIELSLFFRDSEGNPMRPSDAALPQSLPRPEPISPESLQKFVEMGLKNRPEIKRLNSSAEQNEIERAWADNQLSPRIDLQVAAARGLGTGDITRQGTTLEASVLLEIPLERRLSTGRRDSASATRTRLALAEKLARERVVTEVSDALSALNASYSRVQIAESETVLSKKLEEGERDRFKHGDSNILFVNLREQATADAFVRETEALADFQKGFAQLRAAAGEMDE